MAETTSEIVICCACKGRKRVVWVPSFGEDPKPRECTLCEGQGLLVQTTTIEFTPVFDPQEPLVRQMKGM